MIRRVLPTTLLALLVAAATAESGCSIGSGTTGKLRPTLPDGAPAEECASLGDCKGITDPSCGTAQCINGACSYTYADDGQLADDQISGDCREAHCDGSGGLKQSPLDTDVPPQVAGDCRSTSCSSGSVSDVADDSDLPDQGDNDCIAVSCKNGAVSQPTKTEGSACSSNGGRFCSQAGTCLYCAPIDSACDDPGPTTAANNTEATAYDVGSVGNDDSGGKEECGAFKSSGDVDWYHYEGDTESVIIGSPYENDPAGLVVSDVDVTLCIYMTCTQGPTGDFLCPGGTTPTTSAGGHDGCCLTGKNPGMDIRHVCQDAGVWMSVTAAAATTCSAYDFSFHY